MVETAATTLVPQRRHTVLWASLALIFLITVATGWDTYAGWRAHREVVERQMATLAEVAASQVESSVRAIDVLLEDATKSIDLTRWPDEETAAWLKSRVAAFPEIRNFVVIDANGVMVGPNISTQEMPAKVVNVADREYFQYLREHWREAAIAIAAPVISKVHNEPSLPLARALASKDGEFAGLVVVGLDPAYFEAKLKTVAVAEGAAALLRRDGIFLARYPDGNIFRGRSVANGALFAEYLPQAPAGVVRLPTLRDNSDGLERVDREMGRLVAYRTLDNYPLVVSVSVPLPAAFREWRGRIVQGVATVLVLSAAVMVLAFLLERREWARAHLAAKLEAHRRDLEQRVAERTELVQRRYESLRALSGIAALPPGSAGTQLTQALALGARHLALPFGIISRIEGDDYTVVHHCAPLDVGLSDGQVFQLGKTYCAITLRACDVVAIPHMAQSAYTEHPCYREFNLEAYIGAPVLVGNRPFGTVCFTSVTPYHRDFDDGDLEFMRLLARWVGSVLERELAEAEVVAAKDAAEQRSQELANSNGELEQFAYVASHDLRQPLRMVTSYLTLIERRFADKLDADGREFIGYARDGALQMDRLILDLLEYSRVGRHGQPPEPVDLAEVAAEAKRLLQVLVEETAATLELAAEPAVVIGNRTELVRLFQNLIGNGIKYRAADRPPHVVIRWQRQGGDWLVSVSDNGIGISPEYREDVFKIFRRLHTSSEYEGTGIGLAVCQKIVKKHGGRIWIDSGCGDGTTFSFTLPAPQ